jgi:predicted amidohydrolase
MELTRLAGLEAARDLKGSLAALQDYIPRYRAAYQTLAERHGVFILAGSMPILTGDGRYVNRARFFAPSHLSAYQEKLIMTRFESEEWGISPSDAPLNVFDIGVAKVGVAICYDAEFPLVVRALAEGGAELILVPSCTDTLAGYHRVRTACAARALENQCYTAMSVIVGEAPWSPAIDVNVGAAGVFAPPDRFFPADGIIASGDLNASGWVFADLDFDLLAQVRNGGEVLNDRNWPRQPGLAPLHPVTLVPLT